MPAPSTRRDLLRATAALGVTGSLGGCLSRAVTSEAERQVPFARIEQPQATPPQTQPTEQWTVETAGKPGFAVDGDALVVVTDGRTRAIDAADGTERWSVDTGGWLSESVAGRQYVVDDDGVLRAVAAGEVQWDADPGYLVRWVFEGRGTVYVKTVYALVGLHADTGEHLWTYDEREEETRLGNDTVPVPVDDSLLVVGGDGVYRLRERTGTDRLWRRAPELATVVAFDDPPDGVTGRRPTGAVVRNDGLFVSTWLNEYNHETAGTGRFQRFSLDDGTETWRSPTPLPVSGVTLTDSSAFGAMWVPAGEPNGGVVAVDSETGDRRWVREVGHLLGGATVADDVVVAAGTSPHDRSLAGGVYAVDAATGERLWRVRGTGGIGTYPTALVGGTVYYADGAGLHALW
ncbi:Outer membrane protein assembly factor BamB, contains PQQ-like beta-propeller repeat [Halogranum gelatinilyticum]|uniref:Outer membrane protein assembly factor BamB, contains PQQ-like beta-propeller repeat n=1 Tax=Halogranum gelatinilyticum TaxID=660521 RepID=A0A1G9XWK5_9EURY|nr:PQQ-binding-like beta-propeller repeat protein [Halogranum gelatinilyticum]SDN01168.1 Outer membrane protein assembly factor BamB, contains PQQ-like beta-propeller repeat [Halogranum gelatinilyticum]